MAWHQTADKPLSRSIMVRIFAPLGLYVLRESCKMYSDQNQDEKPSTTCAVETPKWVINGITDASKNVAWFGNLILLNGVYIAPNFIENFTRLGHFAGWPIRSRAMTDPYSLFHCRMTNPYNRNLRSWTLPSWIVRRITRLWSQAA